MKKALSIVEVLVSIVLITIIIGALLKIDSQNAQAIINFKKSSLLSSSYSIASIVGLSKKTNESFYISDKINFDEDDIDKRLKELKFEVEVESLVSEKLYEDMDFPITLTPTQIAIRHDKNIKKITLVDVNIELAQ